MQKMIMDFGFASDKKQNTHLHQNMEILYLLQGELAIFVEEETFYLKEGDYLLVNSNKRHSVKAKSEEVLSARFQIDYAMLAEYLGTSQILFWCNTTVDRNESYSELRRILDRILTKYFEKEEEGALLLNSLYFEALYLLTGNFLIKSGDGRLKTAGLTGGSRVYEIQNYIQGNYQQQISLNDLASQLFLSNAYLSKYIKKYFGLSFLEYLNNVRLFHAVDELLYTDKKIIKIAVDNGFPTTAAFNKTFRESYHMTPSDYRLKVKQEERAEEEITEDKEKIQSKIRLYLEGRNITRERGRTRLRDALTVNAQKAKVLNKPWGKVINIGDANSLLRSDVQKQVQLLKKELDFEYVRFWNVFMPAMYDEQGRKGNRFNFSKLDRILDFLQECQLKPYMELGFKPVMLINTAEEYLMKNENEIFFRSTEQFEEIMEELCKHLVNRYSLENVESWYFEYWNDPRLNLEEEEGLYYKYFEVIYKSVKKVSDKIKVGGAGFLLGYENHLYRNILHTWKKRNIRPDFLTVYAYCYVTVQQEGILYGKKSLDLNFITNQMAILRQALKEEDFRIEEIHISEWNFTISNRNIINDSCAQGAYIIRNCLAAEGNIQMLSYWHGTDLYSEYYDTGAILNGDSGLLTKDEIRKPAFYAFRFLKFLHKELLGKDEYSMITGNGKGAYAIVCHNSKKLTYKYAMKAENEIEIEQQDSLYEELEPLSLEFRIDNVKNGKYLIKTYTINQENGSVQDIWKQMGYMDNLSGDEIGYLKQTSIPHVELKLTEVEDGTLRINAVLNPHEIRAIDMVYRF